jgi:hypothetical protein
MQPERQLLSTMWRALGGDAAVSDRVEFVGLAALPSAFAVSEFAAAAVATAGAAVAELIATRSGGRPSVTIDRRLASLWFGASILPQGWALPSAWDSIAGDYAAADGWIRLHTNAPHHRAAALAVLNVSAEREQVARAVETWHAEALETAVVRSGGCAAVMRSTEAWLRHPQGRSVHTEPVVAIRQTDDVDTTGWLPTPERPLQGLRVLDLTRVLAGPVATRFLAGLGAQVLRIDPPTWDEPAVVPDVTLGKRCARLDLHDRGAHAHFEQLLSQADVLVHGYRADALAAMGLDVDTRRRLRPGLVDVCLNAYGWSGPWRNRRGFDSLVQMSSGIAARGMQLFEKDRPMPLPVQALDHAAGYLMAAAVVRGLTHRLSSGRGFEAKASLARTAGLLIDGPAGSLSTDFIPARDDDWSNEVEPTDFGAARRLRPPLQIAGAPMRWDRPAAALGSSPAQW